MFGLLHTGDLYRSQTGYLVQCTQTYLNLCCRDARQLLEITRNNKELIIMMVQDRDYRESAGPGKGKQKDAQKIDVKIKEFYRELVIHSQTTKLYATFSLESFINTFATFLTNQKILVSVQDEARELILHYISRLYDKMSTLDKWEEVARQFGQAKLNKNTILWKKFCELYRFRDNAVHDKPVFIRRSGDILQIQRGMIRQVKKENPEQSTIACYIQDAYQACKVHDNMINKLHLITDTPEEQEQTGFYVMPNNYHRRIKNLIKQLEELEQEFWTVPIT